MGAAARGPGRAQGRQGMNVLVAATWHTHDQACPPDRPATSPATLPPPPLSCVQLGSRVVYLGVVPAEVPLFSLGDDVLIEADAAAGGHFLVAQRFTYLPVRFEAGSWLQSNASLQAGCTIKERARALPGANVLPGETLLEDSAWDGVPAHPLDARTSKATL